MKISFARFAGLARFARLILGLNGLTGLTGLTVLLAVSARAAINCDLATLQSAVQSAARGATITCNAGSWTWSGSLSITKGISLQGAGAGQTIITRGGLILDIKPDATAIVNEENIKITGFTFDGNNAAQNLVTIQGASGINGTKPYRYLLIGNNTFRNVSVDSDGAIIAPGNGDGQIRGVIYNNTFDRCNEPLRLFSNNDTREWSNTAFNQLSYGTADNLYFEGNIITFSSSYAGSNPGWIETGQGSRLVARFNTWNLANAATPQEVWDIHGFQNWDGTVNSGQTSTMVVEYYGNTLTNMGTYRWINHRGSWGMFFNNTLTGSGGNGIDINGVSTGPSCSSDINPIPTNYNPTVNNTYFFNNTKNGSNVIAQINMTGCSEAENVNWWNQAPSFNGSAGVGIGALANRPATCTTGVGYWATDQGEWNSSHAGPDGQFYKCTAANTWTLYYTPYTYPHPLIGGAPSASCDLNRSGGIPDVADVQMCVNQALNVFPCTNGDVNQDTVCDVHDVQKVVNGALGGTCP